MHRAGIIAVVGQPNVGKSTLINAIVGHKVSIVSSKPQTTRRRAIGIYQSDECQVVFIDTPGIHAPHTKLGKAMVDQAKGALSDTDAILVVVDVSRLPNEVDKQIAKLVVSSSKDGRGDSEPTPILLCLNKMDLLKPEFVVENTETYAALFQTERWMLTMALKQQNLSQLLELVQKTLPESEPLFPSDEYTDQSMRFMVSEIIREKVLLGTREEIPHSTAVRVESWADNERGDLEIGATVLVEKTSQRAILIGKAGQFIKKIGTEARAEIEELTQRHVFLELHVLVREQWRQNPRMLRELEYTD